VLQEYPRSTPGVLQEYLGSTPGVPQEYPRSTPGVPCEYPGAPGLKHEAVALATDLDYKFELALQARLSTGGTGLNGLTPAPRRRIRDLHWAHPRPPKWRD